jgi:amino acid transporter
MSARRELPDAFRLLLAVLGLLMLVRAALLLRRLRNEARANLVGSLVLLGTLTAVIGVTALVASVFPSPATIWILVAAMVALPLSRMFLGRRQHR